MYAAAYLAQEHLKEKVSEYYIHPLVKGNKKYPSPLVFPWTAPAVTPMGKPSFSLRWRKGFNREYAYLHKPVPEFIWTIPANQMTKFVPVAGPYGTDEEIAQDFIDGGITENEWWYQNLEDLDWKNWDQPKFQAELVRRFPRSYQCWDFKRLCEFHRLCFRREGWEKPLQFGYEPRRFR
jgi:hypothetical protein